MMVLTWLSFFKRAAFKLLNKCRDQLSVVVFEKWHLKLQVVGQMLPLFLLSMLRSVSDNNRLVVQIKRTICYRLQNCHLPFLDNLVDGHESVFLHAHWVPEEHFVLSDILVIDLDLLFRFLRVVRLWDVVFIVNLFLKFWAEHFEFLGVCGLCWLCFQSLWFGPCWWEATWGTGSLLDTIALSTSPAIGRIDPLQWSSPLLALLHTLLLLTNNRWSIPTNGRWASFDRNGLKLSAAFHF